MSFESGIGKYWGIIIMVIDLKISEGNLAVSKNGFILFLLQKTVINIVKEAEKSRNGK